MKKRKFNLEFLKYLSEESDLGDVRIGDELSWNRNHIYLENDEDYFFIIPPISENKDRLQKTRAEFIAYLINSSDEIISLLDNK